MTTTSPGKAVFHLDREHTGVRYAVILILLLTFVLSYVIAGYVLRALLPEINTTAILSCLVAIPVSLLFSALGEWLLKRTWHSGRTLTADAERFHLQLPQMPDKVIDRKKTFNSTWWQIPLAGYARGGRERRIPARWTCMAGQLQQDDTRIVVFCYAPPPRRQRWQERYEFEMLRPEHVYNTSFSARIGSPSRPELPPDVIAGRHGRFWLAERNRWREGVEMTPDDFEKFLELSRSAET